jgi:subtilase family serine protease
MSIFAASGDEGSADCDAADTLAQYGLQVNGLASSPFVTAVGGTDVAQTPVWNGEGNLVQYFSESAWNASCAGPQYEQYNGLSSNPEQACKSNYEYGEVSGTGGGVSACTDPSTAPTPVCSGGYAKPAYQTGTGVPADGKRDLPDLSLFASNGSSGTGAAIECTLDGNGTGCTDTGTDPVVIEIGDTGLAADAMAGIMALVVQSTGAPQGNANYVLYQLAAQDNRAACNSNTVSSGNSCNFYDITAGNNEQPCALSSPYGGCVAGTSTTVGVLSGYETGTGYDLATGLGSINVGNLVTNWMGVVGADGPQFTLPSSLNFADTPVGTASATQSFQITNSGTWTLYI